MILLLFADIPANHLGKASISTLPDELLMELLIGSRKMSRSARREFWDDRGEFRDVSQWRGVDLDAEKQVTSIS